MSRGLFLSVEGIDGAGKSTHVDFLRDYLISKGLQVVVTREPGGTVVGEKIRDLLLTSDHLHSNTELLLYFASRQEIIKQVILPNLENGVCVLADRFVDASIAYQGAGRQLGIDKVKTVYSLLEPTLKTDATFLFDAPLDVALERLRSNRDLDRIEQEPREFFNRVQQAYYQIANEEPYRVKIIRTDQTIPETRSVLIKHVDELLASKGIV
ncbi:MAG: dTMP kinase [Proteobacteria bacterium]|nr:MAG: dTMP kinase [Pseudomonadota bacterium]